MDYRKSNEEPKKFFEKVENLIDNVLRHNLSKEELTKYFLVHCANDLKLNKELTMREFNPSLHDFFFFGEINQGDIIHVQN